MIEPRTTSRLIVPAALLCLILGVAALYVPGMEGPFLFDDNWNLQPARIDSLSFDSLREATFGNESGMLGRPVPMFTFALNWYFGSDATTFAFKSTNVAIHALNTVLVYALVHLLCLAGGGPLDTRRRFVAWMTAATWALHPLHVSAVLYTVQRMTLLMSTFALLALATYALARCNQSRSKGAVLPWIALSIPLSVGSVLSKENGALLPIYVIALELLVLHALPESRPSYRWLRATSLTACVIATTALVAALASKASMFAEAYAGRDFDLPQRLMAQLDAMTLYLQWIALPTPSTMAFYHDAFPVPHSFGTDQVVGSALLLAIAVTIVALRRRVPLASFGLALFLSGHLMESTAIPLELVFEHRNYLPSVGLALAAIAGGASMTVGREELHRVGAVACAAAVLMLGSMTLNRADMWADRISVSRQAVAAQPESERGWIELADAFASLGLIDEAWNTYEHAFEQLSRTPQLQLQRLRLAWSLQIDEPSFFTDAIRSMDARPITTPAARALNFIVDDKVKTRDPIPTAQQLRTLFEAAGSLDSWAVSEGLRARLMFQHHRLLLENRELERARRIIDRLAVLQPFDGEVLMRQAETLAMIGDSKASSAAFEAALRYADESDPGVRARVRRVASAIAQLDD